MSFTKTTKAVKDIPQELLDIANTIEIFRRSNMTDTLQEGNDIDFITTRNAVPLGTVFALDGPEDNPRYVIFQLHRECIFQLNDQKSHVLLGFINHLKNSNEK